MADTKGNKEVLKAGPAEQAEFALMQAEHAAGQAELAEDLSAQLERPDFEGQRADLREKIVRLDANFNKGMYPPVRKAAFDYIKNIEEELSSHYKSLGNNPDVHFDLVVHKLQMPILTLANVTADRIKEVQNSSLSPAKKNFEIIRLEGEFNTEAKRIKDMINDYVKAQVAREGYINLKVLTRLDQESLQIARLMALPEHKDFQDIFAYVVNQAETSNIPREKIVRTLTDYMQDQYPSGDLLAMTWLVLGKMPANDRVEIAKDLKGFKNFEPFKDFLTRGNIHGVFTPQDIQEITGEELSEEQFRDYSKIWEHAHNFQRRMQGIRGSYGSNGVWDDKTLTWGAGVALKAGLYATFGANGIIGLTNHPASLFTNEWFMGAAGGLAFFHVKDKEKPGHITIASKEKREGMAQEQARIALEDQYGTYAWSKWDSLLKGNGTYDNLGIFYEFTLVLKKENGGEIPEKVTPKQFTNFLTTLAENHHSAEKRTAYQELLKNFEALPPSAKEESVLHSFARIINQYDKGLTTEDKWRSAVQEIRSTI